MGIQDYQNHFNFNDKRTYRILCVGESMTMAGGDKAYPRQLEEILNQKHLSRKFQVINKGISGVNTDEIMKLMGGFLNEYKPDMVISMMGISDASYEPFLVEAPESSNTSFSINRFFYDLRVCKLFRGLYKDLKAEFVKFFHRFNFASRGDKAIINNQQNTIYDEIPNYAQGPSDENTAKALQLGMMSILVKDYAHAELIFRILIASPKSTLYNSKSTFYHYLAMVLYQESKVQDLVLTLEKIPFWDWYDIPVVDFCSDQENAGYEIASFKRLHAEFPAIPFYTDLIYRCYDRAGDTKDALQWKEMATHSKESRVYIRTKLNYLKLLELLRQRNITPVLMQYPVRDVGSLKSMVQSDPYGQRIIFIDNQKLFEDAVKNKGYDAIFSDYYAGDFGHPTPEGNRILAENIAQTLIAAMNWK